MMRVDATQHVPVRVYVDEAQFIKQLRCKWRSTLEVNGHGDDVKLDMYMSQGSWCIYERNSLVVLRGVTAEEMATERAFGIILDEITKMTQ